MNEITRRVRLLKQNQTDAELALWELLRRKQLGVRFQRQKPIRFIINNQKRYYVADFLCYECKLVIELDGKIHDFQKEYDETRDYVINELGYKILRISNEDIFNKQDSILKNIRYFLSSL